MEEKDYSYLNTIPLVPDHEDNFIIKNQKSEKRYCIKDVHEIDFSLGSKINFGEFIQDTKDYNSPIEWTVILKEKNKVYLISSKAIAYKPYDNYGYYLGTTWKESTLRKWLNTVFFDNAFSDFEKKSIIKVDTSKEITDNALNKVDKESLDKVFILTTNEHELILNNDLNICEGTNYACCQDNDNWLLKEPGKASCWLRADSRNGSMLLSNKKIVNCSDFYYVRPVICLITNSVYFGGDIESEEQLIQNELNTYLSMLKQKYSNNTPMSTYTKLKSDNPDLQEFFDKLEGGQYNINFSNIADIKDFLVDKGVMVSTANFDLISLVNTIKELYVDRSKPKSIKQIAEEHPELKRQLEFFKDNSVKLFSMSLVDYFINEGIFKSYEEKRQEKKDGGVKIRAMSDEVSIGKTKGRPISVNPEEIVEILRARTKVNGPYKNMDELKNDNPELKGKLKTLANISGDLLGTSLGKYLKEKGIITK